MSEVRDYSEIVAQAEKAVANVKDPELKRVAFQKVLDDLLSADQPKPAASEGKAKKKAPRKKTSGSSEKTGPRAYIREMIDDGFFKKPKTMAEVKAELENRGHHIPLTSLSGPLQKITQARQLRRQRAKTSGKKQTFVYSEW